MGQPLPCLLQACGQESRESGCRVENKISKLFFNTSQCLRRAKGLVPQRTGSPFPKEGMGEEESPARAARGAASWLPLLSSSTSLHCRVSRGGGFPGQQIQSGIALKSASPRGRWVSTLVRAPSFSWLSLPLRS